MPENKDPRTNSPDTNPSVLTRRGTRRSSGADTPSGPNSDRTPKPMERANETAEDMDYSERMRQVLLDAFAAAGFLAQLVDLFLGVPDIEAVRRPGGDQLGDSIRLTGWDPEHPGDVLHCCSGFHGPEGHDLSHAVPPVALPHVLDDLAHLAGLDHRARAEKRVLRRDPARHGERQRVPRRRAGAGRLHHRGLIACLAAAVAMVVSAAILWYARLLDCGHSPSFARTRGWV